MRPTSSSSAIMLRRRHYFSTNTNRSNNNNNNRQWTPKSLLEHLSKNATTTINIRFKDRFQSSYKNNLGWSSVYVDSSTNKEYKSNDSILYKTKAQAEHAAALTAIQKMYPDDDWPSLKIDNQSFIFNSDNNIDKGNLVLDNNTITEVVGTSTDIIDNETTSSTDSNKPLVQAVVDQVIKQCRKLDTRRRLSARSVMFFMLDDPLYFHMAMKGLVGNDYDKNNLSKVSVSSDKPDGRYKHLFDSAVPSFCKLLGDDPKSFSQQFMSHYGKQEGDFITWGHFVSINRENFAALNLQDTELFAIVSRYYNGREYTIAEYLLDCLATKGLSDEKFVKDHRLLKRRLRNNMESRKLVHNKRRLVALRRQQVQLAKENLLQAEHEVENSIQEAFEIRKKEVRAAIEKEKAHNSFFKDIWSVLSGFFNMENNDIKEPRKLLRPRGLTRDERESLGKLKNQVTLMERLYYNAVNGVEKAQELQKELKLNTIVHRTFQQTEEEIRHVLDILCPTFTEFVQLRHKTLLENYKLLDEHTDLTKPHEWYLYARLDKRKIIFHGGPTNSGKTHQALERLKQAKNGIYLGPLRLLAGEVYESFTTKGIYTDLHTGQEHRNVPFHTHTSATMEIMPLHEEYDVVVIDEIQMIADDNRGHAWTRALQGARCKEIHVCGGMEAVDIVKKIAEECGDDFELRQYERFKELRVSDRSIAHGLRRKHFFKNVRSGDCVVCFSQKDVFAVKREIERTTKHRCCVIFGALPPETRSAQARLFNDPGSGFDVLVASDAIGMGLNLNIRRIIFNSIYKSDGDKIVRLSRSNVKQIGGRAGRRNSEFEYGEVSCRDPRDLEYIRECIEGEIAPIAKAGLLPTANHIELFAEALEKYDYKQFDSMKLHKVLQQFDEMATLRGNYFLCRQKQMQIIARMLSDVPIERSDKYVFSTCPVNTTDHDALQTIRRFALKYADEETSGIQIRLKRLQPRTFEELSQLCTFHHKIELFLWLTDKFPGNAVETQTALSLKEKIIEYIDGALNNTENLKLDHDYLKRDERLRLNWDGQVSDNDSSSQVSSSMMMSYSDELEIFDDEELKNYLQKEH